MNRPPIEKYISEVPQLDTNMEGPMYVLLTEIFPQMAAWIKVLERTIVIDQWRTVDGVGKNICVKCWNTRDMGHAPDCIVRRIQEGRNEI